MTDKTLAQKTLEQMIETGTDGGDLGIVVSEVIALADAAREWAEKHSTKIIEGNDGYTQPGLSAGAMMSLRRDSDDAWGAAFDRLLGAFLADALGTMGEVSEPLWGSVVAYSDYSTSTLRTSYTGVIKTFDSANVIFYDDVTVDRELILEIGV